jgi:hypothetical protein
MQHVWGRVEVHTWFWWENMSETDHLEDPGIDKRIILDGSSGSEISEFGLNRAGSG